MLHLGILKTFDSETHTAGVQLVGSLTTYLDNISVSVSIPSSAMVVGNYVLVAIPGGNPRDACVVASWPAGGSGITDHGDLDGLADDDHSQYLNVARHDLTARHTLGSVVPHESALNNLGDVNVPSPADEDVIYWDNAASQWKCKQPSGGGGVDKLDDIGDVNAPSPSDKYFLQYDEPTSLWKAVKGYEFGPQMPLWQNESQFFNWTTAVTGSGSVVAQGYGVLKLSTGSTAGSTAKGRGFKHGYFHYESFVFQWYLRVNAYARSTNGQKWYKIDSDTVGDPTTRAIGFREDYYALKGIVHDGTNLHVIDLGVTLNENQSYRYFLKFIPNDKVEWYVDGVLKGSSTDIPTAEKSSATYAIMSVKNNADNADNVVRIMQHSWICKE